MSVPCVTTSGVSGRPETVTVIRRSGLASRRAVLQVRAPGDAPVPADLTAWYAERAFQVYGAGLRLPAAVPVGARPRARYLTASFADLDAASGWLTGAEGMTSVIVTARGRGAVAVALWRSARTAGAADALVLHEPVLPTGAGLSLDIDCPVLVLAQAARQPQRGTMRLAWLARGPRGTTPGLQLGDHVTWLRLAATAGAPRLYEELGRWLGAYMYGDGMGRLL